MVTPKSASKDGKAMVKTSDHSSWNSKTTTSLSSEEQVGLDSETHTPDLKHSLYE
jgi:hypothetical protein